MTIQDAQNLYINKIVKVKNAVDGSDIVGMCTFIGHNEMINWPLQITVDRMPIKLDSLEQVSLVTTRSRLNL